MKQLFTLFLCLLVVTQLEAQAPPAFAYQGIARDAASNPIANQAISLRISILTAVDGPAVFSETHTTTTNEVGLFTIFIGRGDNRTITLSELNWGIRAFYLQVEFDENGGDNYRLLGTTQLLSVPYALYAEHSGDSSPWVETEEAVSYLGAKPIGVRTTGNTFGILMEDLGMDGLGRFKLNSTNGNTNIGVDFGIGGDQRWVISARGREYPFQPESFLIDYNDGNGFISSALIIDKFGKFGMRTLEPHPTIGMLVEDNGTDGLSRVKLNSTQGNTSVGIDFGIGGTKRWVFQARGENYPFEPSRMVLNYLFDETIPDPVMVFDPNGSIGLGTLAPKSRFHVNKGDIYIEEATSGVIMTSPNGQCWRMTVTDMGTPEFTAIDCPN